METTKTATVTTRPGHSDSLPKPGSEIVAALPRSPLHIRFIEANAADVDIIFYRDARLRRYLPKALLDKAIDLGREKRWPGDGSLIRVRRENADYYQRVGVTVGQWRYAKFVIFLESEPLENFLIERLGPSNIELWEEGLGHYTEFHGNLFYAGRAAAQLASGFHARRIFHRRADRDRLRGVRDRFVHGNLALPRAPAPMPQIHDAFLVIGAPLAQDGWISWRKYLWILEQIVCAAHRPIVYYPHPREDVGRIEPLVTAFGRQWFEIVANDEDVAVHCRFHHYHRYVAAFSTALLEVGTADTRAYIAGVFGLDRVHRALVDLGFIQAHMIDRVESLAAFFHMGRPVDPVTTGPDAGNANQEVA